MSEERPDPDIQHKSHEIKQVDDHVQNSALGAVKPMVESLTDSHVRVPVSAATPDAEPKAERKLPPQVTGHDIASQYTEAEAPDAYRTLPKGDLEVTPHDKVVADNAAAAIVQDEKQAADPESPLEVVPEQSDPPFPRAHEGIPPVTYKSV